MKKLLSVTLSVLLLHTASFASHANESSLENQEGPACL